MVNHDAQKDWVECLSDVLKEINDLIEEAKRDDWLGIEKEDLESIAQAVTHADYALDRYRPKDREAEREQLTKYAYVIREADAMHRRALEMLRQEKIARDLAGRLSVQEAGELVDEDGYLIRGTV